MKKLLLLVALLAGFQLGAQTMDDLAKANTAKYQAGIDKAIEATQHPKKGLKSKTWVGLAKAYIEAYNFPASTLRQGASQMEVRMMLNGEPVLETAEMNIAGVPFFVEKFYHKDVYYDQSGTVQSIIITRPVVEGNLLALAVQALNDASTRAASKGDNDKVAEYREMVQQKYFAEGLSFYTIAKYNEASESFGNCAAVIESMGRQDTTALFYAGLTAVYAGNGHRAIEYLDKCFQLGYDAEGNIYSLLADAYKAEKNYDKAKEILMAGFKAYSENQSILVSLINLYTDTNDDPNKILDLIRHAQSNEPDNASLYYTEGNVWLEMKNLEKAIECYEKSIQIDPKFVYGYYAIGEAHFNKALELQTAASSEMDDAKYTALMDEFDVQLKGAIKPFEDAFNVTDDAEIKGVIVQYLTQIYFRYRSEFPNEYAKYKEMSDTGVIK